MQHTEEIDMENELSTIAEEVRKSVAEGKMLTRDAVPITVLTAVASLLVDLNRKLDDTNDYLEEILTAIKR